MKIQKLPQNKNLSFKGIEFNGKGFLLSKEQGQEIIAKDFKNANVIKNLLIGRDLNQTPEMKPTRMIIDFQDWSLEEAKKYKDCFEIIEKKVKPERLNKNHKSLREKWWLLASSGSDLRKKLKSLDQFIVTAEVSKYKLFAMVENKNLLVNNKIIVIAKNNYSFLGILSSKFHVEWAKYNSSSLGETMSYTNTTCFETFPFPEEKENEKVSSIMKQIESYRRKVCQESQQGLTTLYNKMFEGKHHTLKELHKQLDIAVANLYNFPIENLGNPKEILKFLITLNNDHIISVM